MSESTRIWSEVWAETTVAETLKRVEAERRSLRWRRLERLLTERLGDLSQVRSVEIGAGVGTNSLLLARRGAQVTLVDEEPAALRGARAVFEHEGLRATFLEQDLFSPTATQEGSFDIVMSYGLAEHFRNDGRNEVVAAHARWLKRGRVALVSVPNAFCPSYRAWKWLLTRRGQWPFGYEQPFSPRELRRVCEDIGGRDVTIVGSSALGDALRFITPMIAAKISLQRWQLPELEVPSPVDALFGYSITAAFTRP